MPKAKSNKKSSKPRNQPQNQPQKPAQDLLQPLSDSGYDRARVLSLSEYDKIVGGITWAISVLGQTPEGGWKFKEDEPRTPKKNMAQKKLESNQVLAALYKIKCPLNPSLKDLLEVNTTKLEPVVLWLLEKVWDWEFKTEKNTEDVLCLSEDHETVEIGMTHFHSYLKTPSRLFTTGQTIKKFDMNEMIRNETGHQILEKYLNYSGLKQPYKSSEMPPFVEALCSQIDKLELPKIFAEAEELFLKKAKKFFQKKEELFFHLTVKKYCAAREGELLQIDCERLAKKVSQIEKRIALLMKDFDEKMKIEVEKLENGKEKGVGFFDEDVDRIEMDKGFCIALGIRLQDAHNDFLQCDEELAKNEKDGQVQEPSNLQQPDCKLMEMLRVNMKKLEEFDPFMGTQGQMKRTDEWEYCVTALEYMSDVFHFFIDWIMKAEKLAAADCGHLDHRLEKLRNEAKNAQKMLDFAEEKVEKFKVVYSTIKILQYQLPAWEKVYKMENRPSVSNAGASSSVGPDNN